MKCESCGRYREDGPRLLDPPCENMGRHECGYPTHEGACRRPWGHSAYDGIGHNVDRYATRKRGGNNG